MRPDIRNYAIVISIIAVLGLSLLFPGIFPIHPRCPVYSITGIPCPGCGSTRATLALIHGDIQKALWYNPLAIAVDIAVVVYLVWYTVDIIRGKDTVNVLLKRKWRKELWIPVLIIIVINWIFNIYKFCFLSVDRL